VREAAVVGVPSPLGEEEVKLCVLLHEGATLDPAALEHSPRPRLTAFMRPRYIKIRAGFPRTPTQRVQKYKLREEGITSATWTRYSLQMPRPT
jgi:crotonobetaine/carnitine-CoA ligase